MNSSDSLTPFFNPRGVVVIGVSHDPTKLGYGLARNLVQSGYQGAVHFVNPKGNTLLGFPVYPRVGAVPDPVDLAVLLVPPPAVPDSLRECGERGIRAAIIATGGFREAGPEGAALEDRCLEIAREYGMRLVGPNCIGLMDTHLPLDTTFLQPPMPPAGSLAFISHSGAICAAIGDWIKGQGIGFSHLISLGNQADVNETDVLAPVAADPHTRVITLYLEGIRDGRRFVEQARQVSRLKPIVALKVGRFESGKRAAASHTGALAGQETAFDAAFQKAGVLRASTTEEMFQWARALAWCPPPQGRRAVVLTNAGGPGVTAADALELNGLRLADLREDTVQALRALLPPAASLHNPIDMLASASAEQYAACLRTVLADPGVDSAMIIFPPPPASTAGTVAKAIIPVIQVADKPVVVVVMGERLIQEAVELFRAAHVPDYRFPEPAASALAALYRRAESLRELDEAPMLLQDVDQDAARRLLEGQAKGEFLSQEIANRLLKAYGISTLETVLATSVEQAVETAGQIGFPVVMKVASPDIPHKSDVGGVLLNLASPSEVAQGYQAVIQKAKAARPEARIEGVHLQRMLTAGSMPAGQDVIAGVVQDRQFGPVAMFGSGGVEVEGLKDVEFALAPLTRPEAERMLEKTWAGRKLKGFRSLPPADRQAALQALGRLAQLAADFPQLAEIEINPLRVLPEGQGPRGGQGAVAIDVRIKLQN